MAIAKVLRETAKLAMLGFPDGHDSRIAHASRSSEFRCTKAALAALVAAAAKRDPELAVLSALAHGRTAEPDLAVRIALAAIGASVGLDAERSVLYFDLVRASLGEAAKRSLQAMDPAKYEFQSDFAKRFIEVGRQEGRQEGRAEGRASTLLKLLHLKFGTVPEGAVARVQSASSEELDRWTESILNATSIAETLR